MKNSLKNECAILIQSCDAYRDIWPLFFTAFKHNWPECDLDIYLNTESASFKFDGLKIITVNNEKSLKGLPWGKRLLELLQLVDKPFVISLFDDFLLEDKVDVEKVYECIQLLKRNSDIAAFYFLEIPGATKSDGTHTDFNLLSNFTDYKINSAPAIWRKKHLQKYTGAQDNPWAWEVFGTARTYFEIERFYAIDSNEKMAFKYSYALGGAIRRGKWVEPVVVPLMKAYNVHIDLSKRGVVGESLREGKHSIRWKIDFIRLGFEMVGARAFVFILRAISQKILKAIK